MGTQYIDDVTWVVGSYVSGTLLNTQTDDGNAYIGQNAMFSLAHLDLFFDPVLGGRDLTLSIHATFPSGVGVSLRINDSAQVTSTTLDFDDEPYNGVNTIDLYTAVAFSAIPLTLYYLKLDFEDLGYGHDFMGVPATNIGIVSGVPTANIANIKGV